MKASMRMGLGMSINLYINIVMDPRISHTPTST